MQLLLFVVVVAAEDGVVDAAVADFVVDDDFCSCCCFFCCCCCCCFCCISSSFPLFSSVTLIGYPRCVSSVWSWVHVAPWPWNDMGEKRWAPGLAAIWSPMSLRCCFVNELAQNIKLPPLESQISIGLVPTSSNSDTSNWKSLQCVCNEFLQNFFLSKHTIPCWLPQFTQPNTKLIAFADNLSFWIRTSQKTFPQEQEDHKLKYLDSAKCQFELPQTCL